MSGNAQPECPAEFNWMWPGVDAKALGQYGQLTPCTIQARPVYSPRNAAWKVMVKEKDNPGWMPQFAVCESVFRNISETLPTEYEWIKEGVKAKLPSGEITKISVEPRLDAYGWFVGTESQPVYAGVLTEVKEGEE